MAADITAAQVWEAIDKQLFAVVGMVTAGGEARTVGIVYTVNDHKLYIGTGEETWKVRHVKQNPNVSVTVPVPKRIPFMPWFKIPAATVTFSGTAAILGMDDAPPGVVEAIFRGLEVEDIVDQKMCLIEVAPRGHFMTYGIGVPLQTMRNPVEASGRVAVG